MTVKIQYAVHSFVGIGKKPEQLMACAHRALRGALGGVINQRAEMASSDPDPVTTGSPTCRQPPSTWGWGNSNNNNSNNDASLIHLRLVKAHFCVLVFVASICPSWNQLCHHNTSYSACFPHGMKWSNRSGRMWLELGPGSIRELVVVSEAALRWLLWVMDSSVHQGSP